DAGDLVKRQLLKQDPANLAQDRIVEREQVGDEERLVIAHLAPLEVPKRDVPVEERVACQRLAVQRRQLRQLAVRRQQERVQDLDPDVALSGDRVGHRRWPPFSENSEDRSQKFETPALRPAPSLSL